MHYHLPGKGCSWAPGHGGRMSWFRVPNWCPAVSAKIRLYLSCKDLPLSGKAILGDKGIWLLPFYNPFLAKNDFTGCSQPQGKRGSTLLFNPHFELCPAYCPRSRPKLGAHCPGTPPLLRVDTHLKINKAEGKAARVGFCRSTDYLQDKHSVKGSKTDAQEKERDKDPHAIFKELATYLQIPPPNRAEII